MTLIVGIRCADGAVLCADGAATFGSLGVQTIRQPVRKKLSVHHGTIVIGVSGPVGLGQRFSAEIDTMWEKRAFISKTPTEAAVALRDAMWKHVAPEMQAAALAQNIVGAAAANSALSATVVALPVKKELCVFEFDQQCASERLTDDIPFLAIGSGQNIAHPFLAFLRRVLWAGRTPSLGDGITAALWTVQHAIQVSPGGVADPIQLVLITRQADGTYKARELPEEELQEHREAIATGEDSLARWYSALHGGASEEPGEPAAPPPEPPT